MTHNDDRATAAQQVLGTPELLDIVFKPGLFDKRPLAQLCNNALVCRTWSSAASDWLWKTCYGEKDLVEKLAPTTPIKLGHYFTFTRRLTHEDSLNFNFFARKVRVFFKTATAALHPTTYDYIADNHPEILPLLPNIHTLRWSCNNIRHISLFAHDRLRVLSIDLPHPSDSFDQTFTDIARMAPNLTEIGIRETTATSPPDILHVTSQLVFLYPRLLKLEVVRLSPSLFTPEIAQCLGSYVERLSVLDACDIGTLDHGPSAPWRGEMLPDLRTLSFSLSSFSSLRCFDVFQPLGVVSDLIGQDTFSLALEALHVETSEAENASVIHDFLAQLHRRFPSLHAFHLFFPQRVIQFVPPSTNALQPPYFDWQAIILKTLTPILQFSKLTTFVLDRAVTIEMSDQDVEKMVSKLPLLTELALCPNPVQAHKSSLTLQVLIPIARYCPRLEQLDLFVDGTSTCPLLDPGYPTFNQAAIIPFRFLDRFSPGLSLMDMEAVDRVASYLSLVLPPDCGIENFYRGVLWNAIGLPAAEVLGPFVYSRSSAWKRASELFKLRCSGSVDT